MKAKSGKTGEIIARFSSARPARVVNPLAAREIRRCTSCGVRKLLSIGFYRHRTGRGGYRAECKRCRNRQRAAWARARYVPRTGRRYVTKADRAARAEAASDARGRKG